MTSRYDDPSPRTRHTPTLPSHPGAPPGQYASPNENTVCQTPAGRLRALSADEERLVVLCCSLAGPIAQELLHQADPARVPALSQAAGVFSSQDRSSRLSTFARLFTPATGAHAGRRLTRRLQAEPPWYSTVVCQVVAPEVRDQLLASPAIRECWHRPLVPHPALANHARRFAVRCLSE